MHYRAVDLKISEINQDQIKNFLLSNQAVLPSLGFSCDTGLLLYAWFLSAPLPFSVKVNPLERGFDPLEHNVDSQFPLKRDCASFEYQLYWICNAELANLQPWLLSSMVSTIYLGI